MVGSGCCQTKVGAVKESVHSLMVGVHGFSYNAAVPGPLTFNSCRGAIAQSVERPKGPSQVQLYRLTCDRIPAPRNKEVGKNPSSATC